MKYFTLLLFVLFILHNSGFSQEIVQHDKIIYESPEGKLFIQKSLPLYLWMTHTPNENDNPVLLINDSLAQYTNPFYLDQEGLNTFRSPSAVDTATLITVYPHFPILFEVYADSKPPVTRYTAKKSKSYWSGEKLFYGENLYIWLNSKDALSGLNKIYYSINGSDYKVYTDSILFNEPGEYHVKYYAYDNVGNKEKLHSRRFTIDLTNPVTTKTIKGDLYENIISGRSSIYLTSKDSISGVAKTYYAIDDNPKKLYKYSIKASSLSEGEHVLKYYAVDRVGNEETEIVYHFYVDKSPPILVEEMMGNSFIANNKEYSSGRNKLKLTAVDNKSGIQGIYYSMNNAKFEMYEKPFYLSNITGSLSVVSYAIDNVNNKSTANEKSTKNKSTYIDLTGPTLKYEFEGPLFRSRDSIYISKNTEIVLKGLDLESGINNITYSVDAGQEIEYTKPFKIESTGKHNINYTGFDNVGNANIGSFSLIVDNIGPDIYSRFSILPISKEVIDGKEIDVYSSHVVLFLSATDSRVPIDRIYYSEDGENFKMYTGLVGDFKRGLNYNLTIKASDKLKNYSYSTVNFSIDNTGPEIFVNFTMHLIGQKEIDGEKIDVYPAQTSLFISVANTFIAYDKIYYSINGGPDKIYQGIVEGFKAGSDITMQIRAIDQLGNVTDKEIKFSIEEY